MAKHFCVLKATPEGLERLREMASEGGKSAQENGKAHRWTKEEAREYAGNRGPEARQRRLLKNSSKT